MGNLSIEQIQSYVMAFLVAIGGSGTVVLIARVALNRLTKAVTNQVSNLVNQNRISESTSATIISRLKEENEKLKQIVTDSNDKIDKLITENANTSKNIQEVLDKLNIRDDKITKFLEEQEANYE